MPTIDDILNTGKLTSCATFLLDAETRGDKDAALKKIISARGDVPVIILINDSTIRELLMRMGLEKDTKGFGSIYVIDCYTTYTLGSQVVLPEELNDFSENIVMIKNPGDFTFMLIETMRIMKHIDKPFIFIMDNLSSMLITSSARDVYSFLHVLRGKVSAHGGTSIWFVNESMHEEKDVNAIKNLVDLSINLSKLNGKSKISKKGQ
ncbi:MAG: hypothetical protein MSIBF_04025 [Candidatus Altiarchaeales archaeon IMC4]|nr:MAG: hypothetical protein MSIBF_04025 [Candidatus Altiarchaeales archaeon IMC4]